MRGDGLSVASDGSIFVERSVLGSGRRHDTIRTIVVADHIGGVVGISTGWREGCDHSLDRRWRWFAIGQDSDDVTALLSVA